jgi:hypothetical protein
MGPTAGLCGACCLCMCTHAGHLSALLDCQENWSTTAGEEEVLQRGASHSAQVLQHGSGSQEMRFWIAHVKEADNKSVENHCKSRCGYDHFGFLVFSPVCGSWAGGRGGTGFGEAQCGGDSTSKPGFSAFGSLAHLPDHKVSHFTKTRKVTAKGVFFKQLYAGQIHTQFTTWV